MGLRPTQGDEKRLFSSNHSPWNRRPSLCHPERSRGICSFSRFSHKLSPMGVLRSFGTLPTPMHSFIISEPPNHAT
jgi:hypothetical protein